MPRSPQAAIAVIAVACAAGGLPASAPAHVGSSIGKENPGRGMIYDGLKVPSPNGTCAGLLKAVGQPLACTHGPDPAPPGVDVRERPSIRDLRSELTQAASAPGGDSRATGGGDPAAASIACTGTGSDGNRVVAVYAHAADVPSQFNAVLPMIGTWAAQASGVFDDSAAQTGGSRQIRFYTDNGAPGCQLLVYDVTLTNAGDDDFSNTIAQIHAINNPQFNGRADRRYMVWMDATAYCGIGSILSDSRKTQSNLNNGVNTVPGFVARIDRGCWGKLATSNSTEAHELVHNLGGVQLDAPHTSGGWHCIDEFDTECYSDTPNHPVMQLICPAAQDKLLDCNDDDYFNTNPGAGNYLATHWSVSDSSFLVEGTPPGPFNDSFAAAQGLAGRTATRVGDTSVNASKQTGEPNHAGNAGGKSIWYSWTAPFASPVTISTAGSGFDTTLGVYTGTAVNGLTLVNSNDDEDFPGGILTSKVTFTPQAGAIYKIAVDGFGGASGAVNLGLAQAAPGPPANNAFALAQTLSGADALRIDDYNDGADKEAGEPNHAGNVGGASIWYQWTAPAARPVTIDTVGSTFDTTLGAYTGAAVGALTQVASNDDTNYGAQVLTSQLTFTPQAGTTYRIAVDGYKSANAPVGIGSVAIRLHQQPPPILTPPSTSVPTISQPNTIRVCKKKRRRKKKRCRVVTV